MIPYLKLPPKTNSQQGFSLMEMAVVMMILGFLLGGLLMPLSAQRDINKRKAAEQQLTEIHDALLGFAANTGRLPCPADNNTSGLEDRNVGNGNCLRQHGFVPAVTLGLNGSLDNQNLMLDSWSIPIRYSLTSANNWEYAKNIVLNGAAPSYRICGIADCAVANSELANNVVAVLFSMGKNGRDATNSPDQLDNTDGDSNFVNRTISEDTAGNREFDDILRWVSPNTLTLHLVRAGQLDD